MNTHNSVRKAAFIIATVASGLFVTQQAFGETGEVKAAESSAFPELRKQQEQLALEPVDCYYLYNPDNYYSLTR